MSGPNRAGQNRAADLLEIQVDGAGEVRGFRTDAVKGRWTFVYAPGAGSSIDDAFGAWLAETLPAAGISLVRIEFPYMRAGRRSPDRPAVLEATWRAAVEACQAPRRTLAIGGRSMGGRIASQVVAAGTKADALALFAYPLHPPGKPEQPRTEHLPLIATPTLFVSGTNDSFGAPAELRSAAKKVKGSRLHLLEGADHGFAVKKSSGRTRDDVFAEAAQALIDWLSSL